MKRASLILGLLLASCAAHHPCPTSAWKTKLTLRGRPAHVCGCSMNADGTASVMPCLDEALAPPPRPETKKRACATACDLQAEVGPSDCRALNATEALILRAYADNVVEFRPAYASCVALAGWKVELVGHDPKRDYGCPADAWRDPKQGCVLGLTVWETSTIKVLDAEWNFNALAHEVGHVLDKEYGTATGSHCGWERRGLKEAIRQVTGERDSNPEDCD